VLGNQVTIHGTPILSGSLDNANTFSGSGDSKQSDSLVGDITVTVIQRLQNGNLLVKGQKYITINQGSEFVRLEGIIRPIDISASNTIPSSQVADARIAYGENGALNDANRPGLLSRFFNSPWMPF
jgi:flagellar L-ring protein precursor FlgH